MNVESFKVAIAKLKAEQEIKAKLTRYLSKQSRKDAETGEVAKFKAYVANLRTTTEGQTLLLLRF